MAVNRFGNVLIPAAFSLLVPVCGAAASTGDYNLDTPIETIVASPAAAAVVNKDIPGLLSSSNYDVIKALNLKQVSALSAGKLTHQMLEQTRADLNALPSSKTVQVGYKLQAR